MSIEENKALYRRYVGAIKANNLDELGTLLASNFVGHDLPPGLPRGPESLKRFRQMVQTAFPDQEIELVEVIAEGNLVAGRMTIRGTHQAEFMRIPRTGKRGNVELIELVRIADGKILERWVQWDRLGMLQQLGVNRLPE